MYIYLFIFVAETKKKKVRRCTLPKIYIYICKKNTRRKNYEKL